jgi:hypothetical protein
VDEKDKAEMNWLAACAKDSPAVKGHVEEGELGFSVLRHISLSLTKYLRGRLSGHRYLCFVARECYGLLSAPFGTSDDAHIPARYGL